MASWQGRRPTDASFASHARRSQGWVGCNRAHGDARPQRPGSRIPAFKKLHAPGWGVGGFDYATVVQPVLDEHCGQCHSGAAPDGRVDLSGDQTDYFNVSYETLARGRRQWGEAQWDSPFVSWIPTYNGFETNILLVTPKAWGSPRSKLADLLLDHHRDRDGKPRLQMTDAERRRISRGSTSTCPITARAKPRTPTTRQPPRLPARPRPDAGARRRQPVRRVPQRTKSTPILDAHHNPQWNSFLGPRSRRGWRQRARAPSRVRTPPTRITRPFSTPSPVLARLREFRARTCRREVS